MQHKKKTLVVNVAIALAVGGLSALLTRNSMDIYERVNQPPLSPPGWVFPVVWTVLFVLMGIAAGLVRERESAREGRALRLYAGQLLMNFLWPILFFCLEWFGFAFFWLLGLELLILVTTRYFFSIDPTAGWLMVPYVLWVAFAGYLNAGVWLLN